MVWQQRLSIAFSAYQCSLGYYLLKLELHINKVEDAPAYLRELQMKDENIYGD